MGLLDRLRGNASVGMDGAFCPSCGVFNGSGASRCRGCGASVAAVADEAPPVVATQAPAARTAPASAPRVSSVSCPNCGLARASADADCGECGHRADPTATVWQLDKHVILRRGRALPAMCVKCGAASDAPPVTGRAIGQVQQYASLDLGLGLLGALGDLIGLLFMRGVDVQLTLCDKHERLRRRVASGGLRARVAMLSVVRVANATDDYLRLGGTADAFRASLPKWIGSFPPDTSRRPHD